MEENAPLIDRLESFIEMAQLEVARSGELSNAAYIGKAVLRLEKLPDVRIKNLCFLFNPSLDRLERDTNFARACDNYTLAKYDSVRSLVATELNAAPSKAWWYDLAVRSSIKECPDSKNRASYGAHFVGRLLNELERQREMSGDVNETGFKIQKLMLLGRRMPSSRYLASVDPVAMPMLVQDDQSLSQRLWVLSSPLDNPLHLRQLRMLSPDAAALIEAQASDSPTMAISARALAGESPPREMPLPADRRSQFEGHAAICRQDPDSALNSYRAYRDQAVGAEKLRSLTLVYAAQRATGSYQEAVSLFADAYLHEPKSMRLIPLHDFAAWIADQQEIDSYALSASIILHSYAVLYGSEYDGDLSDAYENTLDFFGIDRPSLLLKNADGVRRDALIYFMRHVCTITRMEDGIGFDDIDAIENERVQLLQWLIVADSANAVLYISEIKSITKDQAVASMSAHLERSKIYVNEDAVRRSFDAEMRYSFARFRELLIEPELEIRAEAIEQRIRKLLRDAESELRDLKLPSTERDSLFRSMFIIALQEFLIYPNGGLKTYLSTRILHGALEGEMRSNLARAQLLFPREKLDAASDFNRIWASRLTELDAASLAKAREAVVRFSTRFSDNLLELISDKVRIRLTTTPNGLLMYDSKGERMQALRQHVSGMERYGDFVDALFEDFWTQTEAGLSQIKKEIEEVFSKKVEGYLDNLAAGIEQLGDGASDLLNAIVQSRTEFALSVQRVSAWFARSGRLPEEPFKLDVAIETAIRITNNCFPGLEISTSFEGEAQDELPGVWLNPIVDLFCNCFQNVVEHGGQDGPQEVGLYIEQGGQSLTIVVRNRLGQLIDADARAAHIAKKLIEAHDEDGHRAAEETGSGFGKIVRIIKYDIAGSGSLDVRVTEDRDVVVRIIIPYEANQ